MSQEFFHEHVMLTTATSRHLYHDVAADLPIVDVHTHLSPEDIESDRAWTTIDELWLSADHYKWRAMRLAGVPEGVITGDVDPWDRFHAWAATLPRGGTRGWNSWPTRTSAFAMLTTTLLRSASSCSCAVVAAESHGVAMTIKSHPAAVGLSPYGRRSKHPRPSRVAPAAAPTPTTSQ